MSSFDLDTIRHAISSRMQQGRLALSNPSAIVAALATTALFSLLPEGTLSQPLLDSILINIVGGGLGVSALYDFLKGFIDNLQSEEENQYSADEIRQRFEQALRERLEESGQDGRTLRADVSRLLQHVEGINVALSAAPSDLRQPLVDSLIELGSNFEEFRWILIEQSQLLVEIQKRSQDIMSDVQRLVRQVARLEQNQQALPAKLKLLLLLQSERPHPGPLPRGEGESPYKGLPAFQKEDADYFFGREEQVADLVHQLAQDKRFLAVIGPSGSGKSSLVRAGLLSQLDSNTAHQLLHSRDWRTVIFKPGSNPIAALANSVGSLSINIGSRALLRGLQDSPDELARAIRQQLLHNQPLHVRLLLIVDQFEELFTRCRDESERLRFIESLLHVSQTTACRTIVLLTMRADFYGHCASHPRLRSQIQDHHLLVGPLHESELRRVIELPANKAGLQLEPGLTETIIKDVADAPGALPLLSQALLETWKRRQDTTLTRSGYEASGGVQQAIAQTADKVYNDQLTSEQQTIARQIFLRLVELGESEQYDSRRRTSRSELGDGASEVLLKLADARLIVTDQESVEVAHEALIREWPTLRHWLDDDREGLRIHRHLTEAAQEWQQLGRDIGDLYRGARLAQAREWAEQHPNDLNALEQEFLQASQQAEEETRREREEMLRREAAAERKAREEAQKREREQKRANTQWRRLAAVLAVVFLVAVGIAFYANTKAEEALEAEATAEVARNEADQNAQEAVEAQATAEVARNDADQKAEEAVEAQAAAEVARDEAEGQTRIAQAQAKGAQALFELSNNPDRALLLALAAIRLDAESPQVVVLRALRNTTDTTLIRQVFAGHTDVVMSVAFSPTGAFILTGSRDHTARLWDAQTGQLMHTLQGHIGPVESVAFSPTGAFILTGSSDGTARLWDVQAGTEVQTLQGHTGFVTSVAFNPTGAFILTGSSDNTARLWDAQTGTFIQTLQGHTDSITSVAFSPTGAFILTGSWDHTARLWDAQTGSPIHTLQGHTDRVTSVAFSLTGEQLLTGSSDNTARLWDAQTGTFIQTLQGHTDSVTSVAFSPTGAFILTGSRDHTARLWDTQTGQLMHTLQGHTEGVMSVAFSPTGGQLLTGSSDHTARLWDAQTDTSIHTLQGHTGPVESVAFSPTGEQLLTGSSDNTARLWDAQTGQLMHTLQGHTSYVLSVGFSPTGVFMTKSEDSTARLWDAQTGQLMHTLQGHIDGIRSVAFSPTGKQLLTGSFDKMARLWDAQTDTSIHTLQGHTGPVESVAFSPTGEQLLTSSLDKTARLWDAQTGTEIHILQEHTSFVMSVAFSPTGEQLLTGSWDNTARLWDAQTGSSIHTLQGHIDYVTSVAFSPTGAFILTGSFDKTARLWDAQTGSSIHTLQGHTDRVTSVAFSPSGELVATGSTDNTARLWIADDNLLIAKLTQRVCSVWGHKEEAISAEIPDWRGCEAELGAVKKDLARYNELRGE